MRIAIVAMVVALTGCVRYNWVPGPNASIKDFGTQKAQCSYVARHGGTGFVAAGNPNFVAGAAIGHGVGEAVRTQEDFNDCMQASGWQPVDQNTGQAVQR